MDKKNSDDFNVDALLKGLFHNERLNDLFEKRIKELNLLPTNALEILDIEYRALQGILNGTNKRVDYTNFTKLASFLKISRERVISLYFDELEKNFPEKAPYPQNKIDFINKNFDLATLRKAGFIKSITDYKEIENRINQRFGFKSIFEYKPIKRGIAFSAGVIKPKNEQTRELWIENVIEAFEELANPYEYDRQKLIKYIPSIRWQCTNVEHGLRYVISDLYKLGVSVLYQSPLSTLHLRGATLVVNEKPCVVLTDYKGFYPTLWFALMHEISHVLFDLEEIKANTYHISDEEPEDLHLIEKENQANGFAREYLFSKEKSAVARAHINNKNYILNIAEQNHVDASFIYVFYAFDTGKDDLKAWQKAQKSNPDFTELIAPLDLKWTDNKSISEHIQLLKNSKIYS